MELKINPHVDLDVPAESMEPYLGKLGKDKPDLFPWTIIWDYNENPTPKAAFAGMISRMDTDAGRILNKLEQLNIADNTLMIFSSDNGPSPEGGAPIGFFDSTGIYRGGKRDFYEGGIRVPFVARLPFNVEKQAIRQRDWKLIRQLPWLFFSKIELYNLAQDPSGKEDVSDLYPEKVEQLISLMDNAHQEDKNYPLRGYGDTGIRGVASILSPNI